MTVETVESLRQEIAELKARLAELEPLAEEIASLRKKKSAKESTPGFDAFWSAWPANPRKVNKRACLTRWTRANLEQISAAIIEHVEACKQSRDWTKDGGSYIPSPLVYLNQERYLAPAPVPASKHGKAGSLANITYNTTGVDDDGYFA